MTDSRNKTIPSSAPQMKSLLIKTLQPHHEIKKMICSFLNTDNASCLAHSLDAGYEPTISNALPNEIMLEIASFLDAKKLTLMARTNNGARQLTQAECELNTLVDCVTRGKIEEAEKMIKNSKNKKLLETKVKFIDPAGRNFECTVLQYALWAQDIPMCDMLINAMSDKTYKEQRDELEKNGTAHGKHWNCSSMITAITQLKECKDIYETERLRHNMFFNSEIEKNKLEKLFLACGKAQKDVPWGILRDHMQYFSLWANLEDQLSFLRKLDREFHTTHRPSPSP